MASVLKAVTTLIASLKKAPQANGKFQSVIVLKQGSVMKRLLFLKGNPGSVFSLKSESSYTLLTHALL